MDLKNRKLERCGKNSIKFIKSWPDINEILLDRELREIEEKVKEKVKEKDQEVELSNIFDSKGSGDIN